MRNTVIGILLVTVGIIAWDVYLVVHPDEWTISQVMATLPDRHPRLFALVFAAWVALAVHWWWPACPPDGD